jgi:hypothetical protein
MAASVELRFAGPEDLGRIGDFLQELGGPYFSQNRFPGKSALDYYHWKYFGNQQGEAVAGIAIAGERIVSTVAATVKPVLVKSRRLIAYELGDFLTATDFRQRGLFSQLVQIVCSETEKRGASLVYVQPNEISFPLLMKLGFAEPLQIQQRHYARPSSVVARRLHVPAGFISWTGIDDLMGRLAAPRGSDQAVRVELISRFDAETDLIWQQAGKQYELLLAREHEFLNWRYADSPTPFQIWLGRRKEEPVGFLVGFAGLNDAVGEIADVFTRPDDHDAAQALLYHSFREFRRQDMRAILAYTISSSEHSVVGDLLRRACPLTRQRPLHFAMRCFDSDLGAQLPKSGWHLSPGDFDGV